MVLIALSVVIVPFRIGFDAWPSGGWLVLDFVTDITFAIDILLNFRMAYAKNRVMVTTPALIASNYLRGWFTIDLLSTVPFDRLVFGIFACALTLSAGVSMFSLGEKSPLAPSIVLRDIA